MIVRGASRVASESEVTRPTITVSNPEPTQAPRTPTEVPSGTAPTRSEHGSADVSFPVDLGDDDEFPHGDADEFTPSFPAPSEELAGLGVDLSPWASLHDMLDATEPEPHPGDRPFLSD